MCGCGGNVNREVKTSVQLAAEQAARVAQAAAQVADNQRAQSAALVAAIDNSSTQR